MASHLYGKSYTCIGLLYARTRFYWGDSSFLCTYRDLSGERLLDQLRSICVLSLTLRASGQKQITLEIFGKIYVNLSMSVEP